MPSLNEDKKVSCTQSAPCDKCKERKKQRRAQKRRENAVETRKKDFAADLKRHYGMTVAGYADLLRLQDERCAICGTHASAFRRQLHVDHDHETGQIRGLLCTHCNPGLGYFKDSQERLQKAIAYLDKFKKPR